MKNNKYSQYKLLIIQNQINSYRIPLYNELCKYYDLTVAHSSNFSSKDYAINFRHVKLVKYSFGPMHLQAGIKSLIRKEKYDVVIAMFDLHYISSLFLSITNFKFKLIYWGHRYNNKKLVNYIKNYFLKKCSSLILYSSVDVNRLVKSGISIEKIFIANNTMFINNSQNTSSNFKNSLIFVGRLQERKKIEDLIIFFSSIINQLPKDIVLNIIGDGEELESLIQTTESLKMSSRVKFYGNIVDDNELVKYFSNAFAYISFGPIGLSIVHSFAYGVPVFVNRFEYNGPEVCNLVDKNNSFYFESREDLRVMLLNFINNYSSDIGNNSFLQYRNHCSPSNMLNGFHSAINS